MAISLSLQEINQTVKNYKISISVAYKKNANHMFKNK